MRAVQRPGGDFYAKCAEQTEFRIYMYDDVIVLLFSYRLRKYAAEYAEYVEQQTQCIVLVFLVSTNRNAKTQYISLLDLRP